MVIVVWTTVLIVLFLLQPTQVLPFAGQRALTWAAAVANTCNNAFTQQLGRVFQSAVNKTAVLLDPCREL